MPNAESEPQVNFQIAVPEELTNGVYANFCSVWHAPHEFTLDFAVTGQAQQGEPGVVNVPTPVVARIKIPITMAQDLLAALATNVAKYEEAIGSIKKPGDDRPLFPPGDLE